MWNASSIRATVPLHRNNGTKHLQTLKIAGAIKGLVWYSGQSVVI